MRTASSRLSLISLATEPVAWAIGAVLAAVLTVRAIGDLTTWHGAAVTALALQVEVTAIALIARHRSPRRSRSWVIALRTTIASSGGRVFPQSHLVEPSLWERAESQTTWARNTLSQMLDDYMAKPGVRARRCIAGALLVIFVFGQSLVWTGSGVVRADSASDLVVTALLLVSAVTAAGAIAALVGGPGEPRAWTPARRRPAVLSLPALLLAAVPLVVLEAAVHAPDTRTGLELGGLALGALAAVWEGRHRLDAPWAVAFERRAIRLGGQMIAVKAHQAAWLVGRVLAAAAGWGALIAMPLGFALMASDPYLASSVIGMGCALLGLHCVLRPLVHGWRYPHAPRVVTLVELRDGLVGTQLEARVSAAVRGGVIVLALAAALVSSV